MIEPPAGSGTQAETPEQNKLSATISVLPKPLERAGRVSDGHSPTSDALATDTLQRATR